MSEVAIASSLPATTAELTPQQQGWLHLSNLKTNVFNELQAGELAIQAKINGIEANNDLSAVQALIKESKGLYNSHIDKRKQFTGMLNEKLIEPAMAYEKRTALLLTAADAHELAVRKAEAQKAQAESVKFTELANLKSHIVTEYYRIAAEYRHTLDCIITARYQNSLETGELIPAEMVEKELSEQNIPVFNQFKRSLVNDAEAMALFQEVKPFDRSEDLKQAIMAMHSKWGQFDQDKANAASAIVQLQEHVHHSEQQLQQDILIEAGTNRLMAAATATAVPSGPKVIKKVEVAVENTQQWAIAVIGHFQKNWGECAALVRVKSWDKLSIGQMAAALGTLSSKSGEAFTGLNLIEIEK